MPPLVFRYSAHAEYQLFNRNITKQSAEHTIRHPDETYADKTDPSVTVAMRETSPGTFLKVWYRLENGELRVQTAFIITLRRERPSIPPRRR